ncbi:CRISPR-associated Cas5e family protein [Plasticicumulans lactativorans]|uniref:CRISPR-associated Cas5e family protein n=1 Tax=Plasticicumulans lactativorans TaxID=1133106 RepID=A0A4R2LR37_9GAMM|nr:type I-E CRISPR-associated protein Cas5/CasD [Plasticicumulans lactativorans]TCO82051.1 CRISPR-associated Cas5e family protein [Plasticicumulans lactativorans]
MESFLILKLAGPLQAWGGHTFEDFRPSHDVPTRSGLLGLLGACLGVRRDDPDGQQALARSVRFAVRTDRRTLADRWHAEGELKRLGARYAGLQQRPLPAQRFTDFHTVLDARTVGGGVRKDPVVSRREYLADAVFTVAVGVHPQAGVTLDALAAAVRRPVFTPSLGRRSCPPSRPLFEAVVQGRSLVAALDAVAPHAGLIHTEEADADGLPQLRVRDVPVIARPRQFATREVYVDARVRGGRDVPESD